MSLGFTKSETKAFLLFKNINCLCFKVEISLSESSNSTFKTFGCGAAIASSSMTTEMLKGAKVEDALKLTNQAIVDALGGLPPAKIHCSVMAEEAVEAALKDYYTKQGKDASIVDSMKAELKKDAE